MPPAIAATKVSLRELADLAIGTPEVGAVNFTALHTLIVAMLKNLHLQDTQVDFQSLSPEQSRSFEALRASLSTPQMVVTKERRRSSTDRTPVRTLESQVKDLGGQVQDLSRQVKTMESHVQSVVTHIQHFTAQTTGLSIDAPEWLGEQEMAPRVVLPMPAVATPTSKMATPISKMATPVPGMATPLSRMPTPAPGMATPMPRMPTPAPLMATPLPRTAMLLPEKGQIGVTKIKMDSPQVSPRGAYDHPPLGRGGLSWVGRVQGWPRLWASLRPMLCPAGRGDDPERHGRRENPEGSPRKGPGKHTGVPRADAPGEGHGVPTPSRSACLY